MNSVNAFLAPLPLGSVSFEALRSAGEIYVDKTDFVCRLASVRRKLFIARPRRFGKSLLLSTFKSLFQNGLQYFQGLKIDGQWKDRTYPVVHIDFSRLKKFESVESFHRDVASRIAQAFAGMGFRYDPESFIGFYDQLEGWLQSLPPVSYVLLIDEYDSPLTEHLDDREVFRKIRRELASLYSVIKTTEGSLRFLFMTGITKFSQTGIFSELNITEDYSYVNEYAELLGYTEKEIRENFSAYLQRAAHTLGLPVESVLEQMRFNYDGYCFDPKAERHVYNPWSVLHFLELPAEGFENYWIKSGGLTSGLFKYFKTHELRHPEEFEQEKRLPRAILEASADEDSLSDTAFLTQTGYLTIKRSALDDYYVGYPNDEVAIAMARLYSEELLNGNSLSGIGADDVAKVLTRGTLEDVAIVFNRLFLSLDYMRYPVRDESVCRGFLQALLKGARLDVTIERHNAFGRSDLEVRVGDRHWVFEFKFVPTGATDTSVETLLRQACEQIRCRAYGEEDRSTFLMRAAMVYSEEARHFVAWKLA